ncbi:MAG TPA: hypothetical protein VFQ65_13305 [Kofleriaceae bacterium]|nr:hypothetical protein [Kofleriaceae bacterium]
MQTIETELLATVVGGESFGQVIRAANAAPDVPLAQTGAQTTQFIAQHPFFHEGVMNLPIGGGKHFRNVPFVGPGRMLKGAVTGNADAFQKGIAVTHATWNAP